MEDDYTITGRSKQAISDRMLEELMHSWRNRLPSYMRNPSENLEDRTAIIIGTDFSKIESRAIAHMVHFDGDTMVYTPVTEGEFYGRKIELSIFDDFYDVEPVEKEHAREPMKQNGRSAAYLKFDKTKSHRRARK